MISVQIDDSAIQHLQQRLAGLAPRVVAQVYEALQPLIYQSLRTAVPKYFAGSASKRGSSDLLTSRSGNLLNSVLQSIETRADGDSLTVSIGSDLPYARIHEYGGFAGRRGPYKKKDGHRSYIRPRPYLRPAINDLQKALPALLEQAIQQVQVSE
ncbi:MAG TPA: phage virion morphogenesis protein [Candidatus Binatia bacterium]|nr:phage virion morphogenesis protein [Candidatus Binatia bacterium]